MELKKSYPKSLELSKKLHKLVPGGGHTYSKGDDQFPEYSPKVIAGAKGAECWDVDGNRFIDWAMGNRVFILGHAFDAVDDAVVNAIRNGTNFTRPGILEYELAEYLTKLWPCAEMVKFGKNGSDVTTAAIKLARAYTKRKFILVCGSQPFFSIHDWFIGSTEMNAGTLESERAFTLRFNYKDIDGIEEIFKKFQNQIAAIILEPVKNESPFLTPKEADLTEIGISRGGDNSDNFLRYLREKADQTGAVLIFDEMIAGMRFDIRGAHHKFGIYPDLATYGKAISNGYSCSVLAGKREIMELGGIHHKSERVFLLSQTHGSETVGLAATLATLKLSASLNVSEHVWALGQNLKKMVNDAIDLADMQKYVRVIGFDANPQILCTNPDGQYSPILHTLFHQYLIDQGILIPWISITHSHTYEHLLKTVESIKFALERLRTAIKTNTVEKVIVGEVIKPVFRKWN